MNNIEKLKNAVKSYENYPKPGIVYRDITPILTDKVWFNMLLSEMYERARLLRADYFAGLESRGFALAGALATQSAAGFLPVRKKGKTPGLCAYKEYDLEYGKATLELQVGIVRYGQSYIIVDDLLATGGTAKAAEDLITGLGGVVVGHIFAVELMDLEGRKNLSGEVTSILKY